MLFKKEGKGFRFSLLFGSFIQAVMSRDIMDVRDVKGVDLQVGIGFSVAFQRIVADPCSSIQGQKEKQMLPFNLGDTLTFLY